MRNVKYIVFIFILLFFNVLNVYASCTDEEINTLKDLAKNIKITYKHKGKVETEDGIFYNLFDVAVKNIANDMYISLEESDIILNPVDNKIVEIFNNGTWYFDIYSNKCEEKIYSIKVFIPRFNMYSLDPLCDGVNGDDFALCGKYYEYDVDYDDFVARVNHYKSTYNVESNADNDEDKGNEFNLKIIINKILDYIVIYRLYIIISLIILFIILIIIIVSKRRKKRGVLE